MVSFSFKKTVAPKDVIPPLEDDKPKPRQITSISSLGSVPLIPDVQTLPAKPEELVIPCSGLIEKNAVMQTTTLGDKSAPVKIASSVGGFVYLPESLPDRKRKGTSLLMSIRAARSKGEVHDAPDQQSRGYEADEFAWGVLRGMGYNGPTDQGKSEEVVKASNRERYGIGANITK